MVSKTACKRCGRLGSFNEVKLYPLPHDPSQSMFLCEACYRKMLFEKNREKVNSKPCHQCGRIIPVGARLCPYCGLPLRSESLRGARSRERMCGFCSARFVGSLTVCPSCGKKIITAPSPDEMDWSEGRRVTKKIVLAVVCVVGLLVSVFLIHSSGFMFTAMETGDGGSAVFSLVESKVIDHQGRTAVQVFFSSNAGGELRITDLYNHVLGYAGFSSSDRSKIIDIGDVGETVTIQSYTVFALCRQQIVCSESYSMLPTVINIQYLEVSWLYKQELFEDSIQSMKIPLYVSGETPVYVASVDISIDTIKGPYPNRISKEDQYLVLMPGETTEIIVPVDIPGVEHRETHYVTVFLKDSKSRVLCEFTQFCVVN